MKGEFISKIFGKDYEAVAFNDVVSFFLTKQEETSILEFKSGEVEIIDLYKEVAAFLNTEGGLIVLGSPREQKETINKSEKRYCHGQLSYSAFRNKDWLFQKIYANIIPTPLNIAIKEFITVNGNVFLIDIPQSNNPPHQCCSDGRYYIRMECEAKPAPHGLIQALFNKRRLPELSAEISMVKKSSNTDIVTVSFRNDASIPADKVGIIIDVYNVLTVLGNKTFNETVDDNRTKFSFSASQDSLLVRFISIPITFNVNHVGRKYLIMAAFWCADVDFDFIFWTFDPVKREIVNTARFDNEQLTLKDALGQLNINSND